MTTTGGVSQPSIVQDYDCSLAIEGQEDVNALLSRKIIVGSILASLAEDLCCRFQKLTKELKSARVEQSDTPRQTV